MVTIKRTNEDLLYKISIHTTTQVVTAILHNQSYLPPSISTKISYINRVSPPQPLVPSKITPSIPNFPGANLPGFSCTLPIRTRACLKIHSRHLPSGRPASRYIFPKGGHPADVKAIFKHTLKNQRLINLNSFTDAYLLHLCLILIPKIIKPQAVHTFIYDIRQH